MALRPVIYPVEKVSIVKYLVEKYLDLRLALYIGIINCNLEVSRGVLYVCECVCV